MALYTQCLDLNGALTHDKNTVFRSQWCFDTWQTLRLYVTLTHDKHTVLRSKHTVFLPQWFIDKWPISWHLTSIKLYLFLWFPCVQKHWNRRLFTPYWTENLPSYRNIDTEKIISHTTWHEVLYSILFRGPLGDTHGASHWWHASDCEFPLKTNLTF